MELKLSDYTSGKSVYQRGYPENFDGQHDVDTGEYYTEEQDYQIHFKEKWFDGIHISIVSVLAKASSFLFEIGHNHIGFLYCLDGTLKVRCGENTTSISKNQQFLTFNLPLSLTFNASDTVKYIYIQLTSSYYQKLTNGQFKEELLTNCKFNTPLQINAIVQSLVNQKYSGRIKRLFLESKIYELIICYTQRNPDLAKISLKEEDVNKILLAKKLVESDLQNPNSLLELSRKAGINDYKLKKGFKEITGHTVFGYLYKLRMEKAHSILTNEKKTVNEVAFLVGYKNPQHFTVAFKKQYNILPGSLNKS
ncbi:helix-turn-helix domain-containing protein [Pedobacter punctiformis]|uniref:AraC family transcriptional regulator n=1 Tax=Pedobacter punctiformis TaxID=3004097 RepID=A0ABT4L714_9SPHI|nr:AraC family transcriptional regulator [Pedobacter sp. HCMS5-2]MCZ4243626.1 AraC family transcriptional regulator [Pedobacter sp. HCMS5-2]